MKYKNELKLELIQSIKRSIKDYKNIALALSGGLDSSIIAKILKDSKIPFKAYTVSFEKIGSDQKIAEQLAKEFKLNFETILLKENYDFIIKKVMNITKKHDAITIGVGMPLTIIAQTALKDKKDVIVSG